MSLELQISKVKRITKLAAPSHIINKDTIRAIAFVAQRITAHALQSAIQESKRNKRKITGYEHLADAVIHTAGLAFLRDTVPQPVQLNRSN